jgi:hypothetical protein
MDVDEPHRARERGDCIGDAQLDIGGASSPVGHHDRMMRYDWFGLRHCNFLLGVIETIRVSPRRPYRHTL